MDGFLDEWMDGWLNEGMMVGWLTLSTLQQTVNRLNWKRFSTYLTSLTWAGGSERLQTGYRCSRCGRTGSDLCCWGHAGWVLGGKALSRQMVWGLGESGKAPRGSRRSPYQGLIQIFGCGDRWPG